MDGSGPGTRNNAALPHASAMRVTAPSVARDQFDLRELLLMLRRRRTVILGCIIVITLLSVLLVFELKPKYTAETSLLLDSRKTNIIDLQAVMGGLQPEAAAIRSEVDVLRSRQLIAKVIEKLGLAGNPDFNTSLRGDDEDLFDTLGRWRRNAALWLSASGIGPAEKPVVLTPAEMQQQTLMLLIDKLLDHLVIGNDQRSYTIKMSYTADDPALAARIVNAIANAYLDDQLEAKFDATKRANSWLSSRVDDLRKQVNAAEQAVQTYREQNKLTVADSRGTTVSTQQLGELN
jgi:succinoglycan biosynthesis transport protein ExoP